MKDFAVLALVAGSLSPVVALGGELSNAYLEAGLSREGFEEDEWTYGEKPYRNAKYLKGSMEITPSVYLFAEQSDGEVSRYRATSQRSQAGLGYMHMLNPSTAVLTEAMYVGTNSAIRDMDGSRVSLGLRTRLHPRVEGWAKTHYSITNGRREDGDYSLSAGGLLKFTPTWGLTSEIEHFTSSTEYKLGLRATF